jgi:RimJ/RimL family protein N-acetyltransferase
MSLDKSVSIVPLSDTTVEDYLRWFNDDEVRNHLLHQTPTDREGIQTWIDEVTSNASHSYFSVLVDGKNVGHVGLKNIDKDLGRAEVGMVIGEKEYQDDDVVKTAIEGIKSHAKDAHGLSSLDVTIDPSNVLVLSHFKQCDFVEAGNLDGSVVMRCKLN